jgi:hypothetical protein
MTEEIDMPSKYLGSIEMLDRLMNKCAERRDPILARYDSAGQLTGPRDSPFVPIESEVIGYTDALSWVIELCSNTREKLHAALRESRSG